jgi:hypothetical protein
MNVTTEIARTHVANLEQRLQNILTELIFNFDKGGSQEEADRKPRTVTVPRHSRPLRVSHLVNRAEKRISCITIISVAGDTLMPLLVIHHKTTDDAVRKEGWRDVSDIRISELR